MQSANDPTVAPPGMHTMTISAKFAPFDLRGGPWGSEAESFAARILDVLEGYAPNIRKTIVSSQWRSPLDMQRECSLTRGVCFYGSTRLHHRFSFRSVPG